MSLKSSMQMLNLGLSIFNKLHTIQHRQLKMAGELRRQNQQSTLHGRRRRRQASIADAEILDITLSQEPTTQS